MKTIFFLLPTGITVRNFLSTGVIDKLLSKEGIRIILFTFNPEYFKEHQSGNNNIIFQTLQKRRIYAFSNLLHAVLRRRFYRIYETTSSKILLKGPLFPKRRNNLFELVLSQPFSRNKMIYKSLKWFVERLCGVSSKIVKQFEYYQPSLVVSTHPTAMDEAEFLHCAKKLGLSTIGMIKSWDILTTKGYLPVSLDHYLVWNEVMQEEMMRMHQVPSCQVTITGVPQFDPYADRNSIVKRSNFFFKWGLDLNKKTVFYATSPDSIGPEDPEILRELATVISKKQGNNIQIIVRLHPIDSMKRYESLRELNLIKMVFQVPGSNLGEDANMRLLDPMFISELRDTLFHSDVTINTCSSTTLDAVAMNKPVVNIGFDLKPREYYKSCRRYYKFDHFQPILKSKATKVASNFDEFMSLILRYICNPELENEERAELRKIMCYKVDGQSSKRITNALLEQLS